METISQVWLKNKNTFEAKTLAQILHFAGDGKLRDGNNTSNELRELLDLVPSRLLKQFSDSCLGESFNESGYALQDVINQIGVRLGFSVEYGLYRGKPNDIGYDGIWKTSDGHSLVVEVKTTDAYSINLDTIATYRTKLIQNTRIDALKSSILIVVGRQDTGGLEAQVRGSKHAWDIRMISIDSLTNLLSLKETLNDTRTIQQINELLKPREYTRIDELIQLIFITSKDLQQDDSLEGNLESRLPVDTRGTKISKAPKQPKFVPVNFHEQCLMRIQEHLKISFIKESRIAYSDKDKKAGLICSISKIHDPGKLESYWFSLYPHQLEFLKKFHAGYIAYGCGAADKIFLIPYSDFAKWIKDFSATSNEDRFYYHVVVIDRNGKFYLQLPKSKKSTQMDISKFKI
jgi:hypothetical protein